jgi:BirA family biotin operon repressor/biotin-[acetyl-CoA-carboxylase] ligase
MMDILSAELVKDGLETRFIGRRVVHLLCHSSTMEAAREEAGWGAAEGTVVIAEEQTAGKGRAKRVWLSPRGSISLSVVLYPDASQLPYLIMIASVAAARSIEIVTGLKAQLKWPNDVLIEGKKICGILIENELHGDRVAWAVIGIGINVNIRMRDFPEIAATATSLSDELGRELSRVEIIRRLLAEMERLYPSLGTGEQVYREWRDRLITLGKRVQAISGEDVLEGVAEDVNRDGSLLLKHSDGSTSHIVAGDVTLRDTG